RLLCKCHRDVFKNAAESQFLTQVDERAPVSSSIAQNLWSDFNRNFATDRRQLSTHADGFHVVADMLHDAVAPTEGRRAQPFVKSRHVLDTRTYRKNNSGGLGPDAGNARDVVDTVSMEGQQVGNL